jgi:hypothetical protein
MGRKKRSFAHRPVKNGDIYVRRTTGRTKKTSYLKEIIHSAFVTDLPTVCFGIWGENGVAGDF